MAGSFSRGAQKLIAIGMVADIYPHRGGSIVIKADGILALMDA